jgi:ElaB/YqjD/DUF883 family membrane-anchored ribosome-binding protein
MKSQSGTELLSDLQASRDQIAHDLSAMASDAAELLKDVSGRNLQRAQNALAHAQDAIRNGKNDLAAKGGDYVKANPLAVLGAAAGMGLLIGLLLARK